MGWQHIKRKWPRKCRLCGKGAQRSVCSRPTCRNEYQRLRYQQEKRAGIVKRKGTGRAGRQPSARNGLEVYGDDEAEFLRRVMAERERLRVTFLPVTRYLAILREMGFVRRET